MEDEIPTDGYFVSCRKDEAGRVSEEEEVLNPRDEVEEGEVVVEEFDLTCHEAIEGLEVSDAIHVEIASDGESNMFYYSDPSIGVVDKELGLLSVDSSGNVHIFCIEEYPGVTSTYQYLDNFFMLERVETESGTDLEYIPYVGISLPRTLRRTDRANGWTPGRYYEDDD